MIGTINVEKYNSKSYVSNWNNRSLVAL